MDIELLCIQCDPKRRVSDAKSSKIKRGDQRLVPNNCSRRARTTIAIDAAHACSMCLMKNSKCCPRTKLITLHRAVDGVKERAGVVEQDLES